MNLICEDSDELLDLVNEEDQVIGCLERSKVYEKGLHNFRVINAFLINSQGQIWVPRRTAHKRLFSLHLDVSAGGHVASGESYDDAFARELEEELRLTPKDITFKKVGCLTPHQHNVSAFMHVYTFLFDNVPNYNEMDFMQYYWLSPAELLEKIEGDKAKGDLPILVERFLINNLSEN